MSKMWRFVKISSSNFLMITILSLSYLKSEIKSAVLSIWQDNWDNGETVCSTHDIVPRVSNKPVEWNREDKIFVSGHGPFPSYLHRFNLRTHDNCSCGEKGDPIHYATKCESNTEPAGESVASSPVSEEPPVPGTTDELVSCETPVNCSEGESVLFDLNDPGTWPENLTGTRRCFTVAKLMNKLVDEPDLSNTYRDGRKLSKDWLHKVLLNGEKINRLRLMLGKTMNSLFCLPCKLFAHTQSESKSSLVRIEGFTNWTKSC
ncbi:hypothetical protein AVEN_50874-1 [Araneus ventricosus]|uniref:Uncharacterized protein n=1 Tax=Araneus ventricosus TaxID=182803 RepID=A0A4Y2MAG5_ARAVE|nr:hypothetical protein AVEN_50874-1 [Araneus ventricosus]